ncbi:MAG TPA: DUF4428 domain-containing protein [Clostridia bacterium]|nr:DUF4428 domain-containing protein [Clostridia bacterium]
MAFFGRKNCDICGSKIGMLGNRKLEDGNLCKDCAKHLSPFFSDRRRSSVADIKAQMDYREANKTQVGAFNVTRTLGVGTKILLDEDEAKFIVSSSRRWQEENPDVLDYSQVTGCDLEINESQTELKRKDRQGNEVSYNPPRRVYHYDFWMTIHVNHPYFSEIRFKLNSSAIDIEPPQGRIFIQGGADVGRRSAEYQQCEATAEDIKETFTKVREGVRKDIATANAPKTAQTCSFCGATTIPDMQGRCEFCGGAIS